MIHVRFYAGLAERTKCTETEVAGAPLSVEELLAKLAESFPETDFSGSLVAVNGVGARKSRIVERDSQVALLPPIAGG
jgi:molybdopterin converting factor small subunit